MFKKDERLMSGAFYFKTLIIHTVNLLFLITRRQPSMTVSYLLQGGVHEGWTRPLVSIYNIYFFFFKCI